MKAINANQKLTLKHSDAISLVQQKREIKDQIFKEITDTVQLEFTHKGNIYNDYKDQVLLPHKLSNLGPFIAL